MDPSALALLPETEARILLRDRVLVWKLLRPPYPALGIGELRVLRIREEDERIELIAGYERYERLTDKGGPNLVHGEEPKTTRAVSARP